MTRRQRKKLCHIYLSLIMFRCLVCLTSTFRIQSFITNIYITKALHLSVSLLILMQIKSAWEQSTWRRWECFTEKTSLRQKNISFSSPSTQLTLSSQMSVHNLLFKEALFHSVVSSLLKKKLLLLLFHLLFLSSQEKAL